MNAPLSAELLLRVNLRSGLAESEFTDLISLSGGQANLDDTVLDAVRAGIAVLKKKARPNAAKKGAGK